MKENGIETYTLICPVIPFITDVESLIDLVALYSDMIWNFYGMKSNLEYVIAHETAHQWIPFLIGSDQNDEPWLDEGFAVYSDVLHHEWECGDQMKDYYLTRWKLDYYFYNISEGKESPVCGDVFFNYFPRKNN